MPTFRIHHGDALPCAENMKPFFTDEQAGIKIYCGDCRTVLPELAGESIDLTVTSPPYDNLRNYNGYSFDFEGIAQELFRVTKQGGVVVWVVGDATINGSETGTSFRQALYFKEIGFNLHDTMIYEKTCFTFPDATRYCQVSEYMFVFSKGKPSRRHLIADKANSKSGTAVCGTDRNRDGSLKEMWGSKEGVLIKPFGVRGNVWRYATGFNLSTSDTYAFQHPAMFPEKLAYDHIISWSNEGDTILDPMCGSGTTGKMAVIAKRKFIGIEVSGEYCQIAEARIKRASGIPCDIPRRIVERDLPLFNSQL